MPYIEYQSKTFREGSLEIIRRAEAICVEYARQGYDLTLRQLYYQFVARGWIPNKDTEYKRLGGIVNDARLAGLIDWNHLEDRTRNVQGGDVSFITPEDRLRMAAQYHTIPFWTDSDVRIEVWVEKEALAGIVQRAAGRYRVEHFSCRGYVSQSEMWAAAQRIGGKLDDGAERVVILHLGDHDPSGIDMTRDITDRLTMFLDGDGYQPWDQLEVKRIALNMDQIRTYNPPPNPAKTTDARFASYIQRFGPESWELDALDPATLGNLIEQHIVEEMVDHIETYNARVDEQAQIRGEMTAIIAHYDELRAKYGPEAKPITDAQEDA